ALSAIAAGLAALSKSPALALVALLPVLAAWCWSRQSPRPAPGWLLGSLAAWAALFALTFVVAWPAMWSDPLGTTARVLSFASDEGGQTEAGSFFLGAAVDDPGPLFYP